MKNDKVFILYVFLLSILSGLFFVFVTGHPVVSDAAVYDTIGWNIASGHGFSKDAAAPYTLTMFREPLYPFFLSFIFRIFGHSYLAVQLIQVVIFAITGIVSYLLARQVTTERIARYSSIAVSLFPTLANYPSFLLTETLFTFLLVLAVFYISKAVREGEILSFFISGALLGLTALCKSVTELFFIVVFLGFILLRRRFSYSYKRVFIGFCAFMLGFVILITPWILRNHFNFKSPNIALRGELALWMRANKLDDTWLDAKQALVYNFSEFLGHALYPQAAVNPPDFILDDSRRAYKRMEELESQNYTLIEANRKVRAEAIEKIRQRPFKYLFQTVLELEKMLSFSYMPTLHETHVIEMFYGKKNGRLLLSGIRGSLRLVAYLIVLLGLIALFKKWRDWGNWYFVISIIAYINLIYSLLFGLGRYAVPLIPFYLIFAFMGYFALIGKE